MSELKVNKVSPRSGTDVTLGDSGDTFTVPTGASLVATDELKTNKISPSSGTSFTFGDSGDTFTIPSGATITNNGTATGFGGNTDPFRNRIINGNMSVDQRNETATINGTGVTYNVDRFLGRGVSSAGVFTLVRTAVAPTNFYRSLAATVTTADSSIASSSSYRVQQFIEGYNISDLNWGTSDAQSVTLSFYVRSSVTGTFGGNLANGDFDRFNVFSYTINSANTWERKTITISGDTSGNWNTGNSIGIRLNFSLGAGSTLLGSAGSWGSSTKEGVTGQTNLIATNNATWYITGVQLEVGTSATDFAFVPFDVNLQRCQRYYYEYQLGYLGGYSRRAGTGAAFSALEDATHPVQMRASPTITAGTPTYINASSLSFTASSHGFVARVTSSSSSGYYRAYETDVEVNAEL